MNPKSPFYDIHSQPELDEAKQKFYDEVVAPLLESIANDIFRRTDDMSIEQIEADEAFVPLSDTDEDPLTFKNKLRRRVFLTALDSKLLQFYKSRSLNGIQDLEASVLNTRHFILGSERLDKKAPIHGIDLLNENIDSETIEDIRVRALALLILMSLNNMYVANTVERILTKLANNQGLSTVDFFKLVNKVQSILAEHIESMLDKSNNYLKKMQVEEALRERLQSIYSLVDEIINPFEG